MTSLTNKNKDTRWRTPACDIIESDEDFQIVLDLPGVSQHNLEVTYEDGSINVVGEVPTPAPNNCRCGYQEAPRSSFRRTFSVSEYVDAEHINAQLKDGELTLTLPKSERIKPRKISISAG